MANNKKIIWIGIASALLIGGGIFWWVSSKKKADEEEKRKQEEETKKAEEEAKSHSASTSATKYPATPFTNNIDGNKFRAWINKTYPAYAKQNSISLSGDFNNSFIQKAYQQYGADYVKSATPVKTKGWSKNDKVYLASGVNEVGVYSVADKKYAIGNITKYLTLDRPIGYFIEDTGKGYFKVKITTYLPLNKIHSKSVSDLIVGAKDVYLPKYALSNSPY